MKKLAISLFLLFTAAVALPASRVDRERDRRVDRTLKSMTLEEKVGQMLMPGGGPNGFHALDADEMKEIRRDISEFRVGGIHGAIGDAAWIALALNEYQRMSKVPLLTAHNLEAGAGYVLYGATRFPLAMAIGATGDEKLAYEAARVTAREGRACGINVNFYPVADVNNNPQNPIINIRSFGEDPKTVSRFVAAYVKGIQENGELATAKHFPGHGDVATDSHLAMPVLDVTKQRLESIELPPFRAAIDAGVGTFMSAHIWLPQVEPEKGVPSTLSKNVMTGILRDELGFKGLIFTDSMSMRGVTSTFENGDAAVRAVEAGNDMLVGPPNVEQAFNAIRDAVRSGRIPESRIDASVRRILRAKADLGLNDRKNALVDLNRLMQTVGTAENRAVAQDIADKAITLVKDERNVLPLRPSADMRVVQINVLDARSGWREGPVGRIMTTELAKRFPRSVTVQIDDQSTPNEYDMARKLAQMADAVIVNGFIRVAAYKGSIDLNYDQMSLLRDLIKMRRPLVYTAFGSPFVLTHIPELPSYAVTYDIGNASEYAAIKAITGEIQFRGRLPINLPGLYKIGDGLAK